MIVMIAGAYLAYPVSEKKTPSKSKGKGIGNIVQKLYCFEKASCPWCSVNLGAVTRTL